MAVPCLTPRLRRLTPRQRLLLLPLLLHRLIGMATIGRTAVGPRPNSTTLTNGVREESAAASAARAKASAKAKAKVAKAKAKAARYLTFPGLLVAGLAAAVKVVKERIATAISLPACSTSVSTRRPTRPSHCLHCLNLLLVCLTQFLPDMLLVPTLRIAQRQPARSSPSLDLLYLFVPR